MIDHRKLPDLPELENVEVRSTDALCVIACAVAATLGFALFVFVIGLDYYRILHTVHPMLLGAAAVIAGMAVYVAHMAFCSGYRWSTDGDGMAEKRLLGTLRILWTDVHRAEVQLNLLGNSTCSVRANGRTVRFGGVRDDERQLPVLLASCWQHLRRVGKAEDSLLQIEELSLWDTVPDEALEPVEVKQSIAPDRIGGPVIWALLTGMAFMWSSDCRQFWPWIGAASLVSLALVVRHMIRNPSEYHYIMEAQGLRLMGRRSRFIPWGAVTGIKGSAPRSLTVTTNEGRAVFVGPQGKNEATHRANLAWIRHKRDLGMAVPIPDHLRLMPTLADSVAERLDLRMSSYAKRFYASRAAIFVLLAIVAPPLRGGYNRGDIIAGCAAVLATALVYLACSVYHVTAGKRGIVRTSMLGTKRVQWSDVAKYERNTTPKPNSPRCIKLKDARGRLLIALGQDFVPDWYQVLAYTDARLAHLLPRPEDQPAYLARPFDFEASE